MILTDKSPMPHGDHKGTSMINVPADYLLWLWKQEWLTTATKWRDVYTYIEDNLDVIELEAKVTEQ